MTTTGQPVPVRVYETDRRVMVAMPLPGLEPGDIELTVESERLTVHGRERGPHQHDLRLVMAEWSVGPYHREIPLPTPVAVDLTNATYENGVLVLSLPKTTANHSRGRADIRLSPVAATRGEHIGHIGRDAVATSTWAHWLDKHRTGQVPAGDLRDTTPPAK